MKIEFIVTDKKCRHFFFSIISLWENTPKLLIRSGPKNLSEILCLSLLPTSLMETEFRLTEKRWTHHFLYYKSMWETIPHSMANNSKINNLLRPKFELFWAFISVLVTCKFNKYPIKVTEKSWRHHFFHRSRARNSKMTGQIRPNSNSSEILCLSSLPIGLMKTEFIVTEKRWRHHFPHSKSMGTLKGQ